MTLDRARSGASELSWGPTHAKLRTTGPDQRWARLADTAILILGAPRSGTTWLAKIFDSHPDVLYRHEPDEASLPDPKLDLRSQLAVWIAQRGVRVANKRPSFPKSWRPTTVNYTREVIATALSGVQRMLGSIHDTGTLPLPDLVPASRWGSVRAAIKLVNWDGTGVARALPNTRSVFILRHPCGQVASVMNGRRGQLFRENGQIEPAGGLVMAAARAGQGGLSATEFNALPEAAQLAWAWLAFNEPAVLGLEGQVNARVMLYEDLCHEAERMTRSLFAFAGLHWHLQTASFLDESTRGGGRETGYFDVFRSGADVADKWRQTMSPEDQAAVRSVVAGTALAPLWPDLAAA